MAHQVGGFDWSKSPNMKFKDKLCKQLALKLMMSIIKNSLAKSAKITYQSFFKKVSEPYLWLNKKANMLIDLQNRPYRLGVLPNIKIPDNFDDLD